ncbi:MAG: MogA/MoaB family molybdenum cofactor biosynthesis protein [Methanobacteriota archaeon]|nr:MAG: MogA/MoaB family molybdenum cofactor biosynthesis protein [Euryarchaeota archaeon]
MSSETTEAHKKGSPGKVRIAVITISDSKYAYHWTGKKGVENEDVSGRKIISMIEEAGHELAYYTIVPDHGGMILEAVDHISEESSPDAIITTGGTGLGPRDVTIETLEPLFEKVITGFGEVFRAESAREIGHATMLSRATAGVYRGVVVFCLPGSPNACETGTKLILEEISHIIKHLRE